MVNKWNLNATEEITHLPSQTIGQWSQGTERKFIHLSSTHQGFHLSSLHCILLSNKILIYYRAKHLELNRRSYSFEQLVKTVIQIMG